jgi:Helix-turn-helix domain
MSSTADPSSKRAAFAALFRTLRAERGLSYADLQQPTFASRGWISNVASGARWPDRSWVERADEALAVNGRLTAAWDAGQAERELEKRTRALIVASIKDSAEIVEAMAPDAVDVDSLNGSVESLGIAYLSSPPAPMLDQGLRLRQESIRRLREGAVRTHERAVCTSRPAGPPAFSAMPHWISAIPTPRPPTPRPRGRSRMRPTMTDCVLGCAARNR